MSKDKSIPWDDKHADGFCKPGIGQGSQLVLEISPVKDRAGGFTRPYVNCLDGSTVIIYPGDRIEIKGKKVLRVIKKNE